MTADSPGLAGPVLRFCTRCGGDVAPYGPSTVSLSDLHEYGVEPPGLASQPHYRCPACGDHLLATNLVDTGIPCPACHTFMPMTNDFCGACGARL